LNLSHCPRSLPIQSLNQTQFLNLLQTQYLSQILCPSQRQTQYPNLILSLNPHQILCLSQCPHQTLNLLLNLLLSLHLNLLL
jgi:hypothetical protein